MALSLPGNDDGGELQKLLAETDVLMGDRLSARTFQGLWAKDSSALSRWSSRKSD